MASHGPRILSRREHFWRELLPGVDDEESRQIILGFIEEEQRGFGDHAELGEPEERTVAGGGTGN